MMLTTSEKIWDHERQRCNRKLERAALALGASLRDKVVSADLAVRLLEAVIVIKGGQHRIYFRAIMPHRLRILLDCDRLLFANNGL